MITQWAPFLPFLVLSVTRRPTVANRVGAGGESSHALRDSAADGGRAVSGWIS